MLTILSKLLWLTMMLISIKSLRFSAARKSFALMAGSSAPPASGKSLHSLRSLAPILSEEVINRAKRCALFIDDSTDPFHCVQSVSSKLIENDFHQLKEKDKWTAESVLKKGGKYFFTRNGSSIVAFIIGKNYKPGNGFKIIGAHTDSPNLKVKPNSKRSSSGLIQLNVECYGGGLWHTWFDRDLSICGRVILAGDGNAGTYETKLVKIEQPVLRIPNLCIHLRSADEREVFKINKEEHLAPILSAEVKAALGSNTTESTDGADSWKKAQHLELLELISSQVDRPVEHIVDFELSLFDTQKAAFSGSRSEFLCSSRIDNLASCYAILESFIDYGNSPQLVADEDMVTVLALFDHEEVGSDSIAGAGSTLISDAISRISFALSDDQFQPDGEIHRTALARLEVEEFKSSFT